MLPRCILFNPPRSRGSHSWWGTVRAVKSRIERWKSGELIDLWTEVINSSQSQPGLRRGKKKLLLLLVALLMLIVLFMRLQMVSIRKLFVFLLLRMSLQLMMQSLMRCFRSILKPLHYLPPFSPPLILQKSLPLTRKNLTFHLNFVLGNDKGNHMSYFCIGILNGNTVLPLTFPSNFVNIRKCNGNSLLT